MGRWCQWQPAICHVCPVCCLLMFSLYMLSRCLCYTCLSRQTLIDIWSKTSSRNDVQDRLTNLPPFLLDISIPAPLTCDYSTQKTFQVAWKLQQWTGENQGLPSLTCVTCPSIGCYVLVLPGDCIKTVSSCPVVPGLQDVSNLDLLTAPFPPVLYYADRGSLDFSNHRWLPLASKNHTHCLALICAR